MVKVNQAQTTNQLRYKANLLRLVDSVDDDDRPVKKWEFKRILQYDELGVTAQDKYLSKQAKTDVVYKIRVRLDKLITERESHVEIDGVAYLITRIFTDRANRMMELSLNYVD